VDTLIAAPSSTWHRAGSAGSSGTRPGDLAVRPDEPLQLILCNHLVAI
jgi:hypothetical protein